MYRFCIKSQWLNVQPIDGVVVFLVVPAYLTVSHQYPHFWRAFVPFLNVSTKSSYPITSHRWGTCFTNLLQDERYVWRLMSLMVHHIPVVLVLWSRGFNIKNFPRAEQEQVVTNSATISALDKLIRQNYRLPTCEIYIVLSISKETVHHIIHKKLYYGKLCAQCLPKHLLENQKVAKKSGFLIHLLSYVQLGTDFVIKIVACDESWCHHFNTAFKQMSGGITALLVQKSLSDQKAWKSMISIFPSAAFLRRDSSYKQVRTAIRTCCL